MKCESETSAWVDPRVLRTRQMLWEALERLLRVRTLEEVSVADITTEAGVNRATFYDHYADKHALLHGLVGRRFEETMHARGVVFDGTCTGAIHGMIAATCAYLAGLPGIDCPERQQITEHLEGAMVSVVRGMVLAGLRRHPATAGELPELTAATVSGAIYGGAREWVRTPGRIAVGEAVAAIFALVGPMLGGSMTAE